MKWHKYTIHTTDVAEEMVSAMLLSLGIDSIEVEDQVPVAPEDSGNLFGDVVPAFSGNDHRAKVSFYLEEDLAPTETETLLDEVRRGLAGMRAYAEIGEGTVTSSETEDKDWVNRWKEYFHAFSVDDIRIVPSWEEETDRAAQEKAAMVLHIDPGTAFGTGKHETTRLAIRGIRKYLKAGDRMLDIGTGSGILGIVAVKSGASYVLGTDVDPVAFPALIENRMKNGIGEERFSAILGNVITEEETRRMVMEKLARFDRQEGKESAGYDLVAANIIAEILADLTPAVPSFLREGGIYITSGILEGQEQKVIDACEACNLSIRAVERLGEWVCVVAEKK